MSLKPEKGSVRQGWGGKLFTQQGRRSKRLPLAAGSSTGSGNGSPVTRVPLLSVINSSADSVLIFWRIFSYIIHEMNDSHFTSNLMWYNFFKCWKKTHQTQSYNDIVQFMFVLYPKYWFKMIKIELLIVHIHLVQIINANDFVV